MGTKYFRLIFKVEDGRVMFSEIVEQEISQEELNGMNWDSPIVRYEMAGHMHFVSLDRDYLDAMLLGIGTYQKLSGIE